MNIMRDKAGRYETGYTRHDLPVLERYEVSSQTGCWNWLGSKDKGYGRCKWNNKTVSAHRVYYEQHKGAIAKGMVIDHLCRNPSCVNPNHLEVVTYAENARRGAATKLTREQAKTLRDEVDRLCSEYGVGPSTLARLGDRTIWKDI